MWGLRKHVFFSGVPPHPSPLERAPYSSWGPCLTHFSPRHLGCGNRRSENALWLSLGLQNLRLWGRGGCEGPAPDPTPAKSPAHPQSTWALQECDESLDLAPASVRQKSERCFPLLRGPRFLKHESPSNCLRSQPHPWETPLIQGGASSRAGLRCRMQF